MSETLKAIEMFERDSLQNLLSQCTEAQQGVFFKIWPGGPSKMPRDQIVMAIKKCEATIAKNKEKLEAK